MALMFEHREAVRIAETKVLAASEAVADAVAQDRPSQQRAMNDLLRAVRELRAVRRVDASAKQQKVVT